LCWAQVECGRVTNETRGTVNSGRSCSLVPEPERVQGVSLMLALRSRRLVMLLDPD